MASLTQVVVSWQASKKEGQTVYHIKTLDRWMICLPSIQLQASLAIHSRTLDRASMVLPIKGPTKMYVDAILKTHERIVQLSQLNATLCPIFMEVMLKNQPEGFQLSVKPHTEADYQASFKARPELEGLMAQMT
uniref:Mitochondrial ribosomal protein L48 n=1 Tax=Oncorhynchus mykiss TaxID=8022 RepID=A0A8C7V2H7_ONCMY